MIEEEETRPVGEGILEQMRQRHHLTPPVPQPHHDIGGVDLLDPAPLIVDHHRIIDSERLGQCQLHARDQIFQHRPCREAGDNARDAGGGEQRNAELAHRIEAHQRQRDGQNRQEDIDRLAENTHLGGGLARQKIVAGRDIEAVRHNGPWRDWPRRWRSSPVGW